MKEKNKFKQSNPGTIPFIAGIMGGSASTILLYPLDLIKVRMQVSESQAIAATTQSYLNRGTIIRNFRGVIRHEGMIGLYQGLTPALLGSAISWGGYFFFYENIKKILLDFKMKSSTKQTAKYEKATVTVTLGPTENFTAACVSGAIMVLFTNPLWLIKTRMQLQMKRAQEQKMKISSATLGIKPPYKNMFDAATTIVREEGPMALYKGAVPALMLVSHGGVQFVCYEFLKLNFGEYTKASRQNAKFNKTVNQSVWNRFEDSLGYLTMGAASKIIAATVTYPIQVVKSRLQQRSQTAELNPVTGEVEIRHREYASVSDCVKRIIRNDGVSGFFKGVLPSSIRVAPSAAITFVVYESIVDFLSESS